MNEGKRTPVVVFGRGGCYRKKEKSIKSKHEIIAFIDNSVKEILYDEKEGVSVLPVSEVVNEQYEKADIICMSIHFISMWKQLLALGINEDRIRFEVEYSPVMERDRVLFSAGESLKAFDNRLLYSSGNENAYIEDEEDLKQLCRKAFLKRHPEIRYFQMLDQVPASRIWGREYGEAVDRYYIEKFLDDSKELISGDVMEVGDDHYTRQFGGNQVKKGIVLNVEKKEGAHTCNFETGEGVIDEMGDVLICTQVLQFIYELKQAVNSVYRILRVGGVALVTVPGIKSLDWPDKVSWGEYWSFTEDSVHRLFAEEFGNENIEVNTYGNVKTTMAYLYGIPLEELSLYDMEFNDKCFPFIITVIAKKR